MLRESIADATEHVLVKTTVTTASGTTTAPTTTTTLALASRVRTVYNAADYSWTRDISLFYFRTCCLKGLGTTWRFVMYSTFQPVSSSAESAPGLKRLQNHSQ